MTRQEHAAAIANYYRARISEDGLLNNWIEGLKAAEWYLNLAQQVSPQKDDIVSLVAHLREGFEIYGGSAWLDMILGAEGWLRELNS